MTGAWATCLDRDGWFVTVSGDGSRVVRDGGTVLFGPGEQAPEFLHRVWRRVIANTRLTLTNKGANNR